MLADDRALRAVLWVLDGEDVPVCTEVLAQDGGIRFANLAAL